MNKYVKYGIYFLIAGIVINHLFRLVFHSVPVDKLIMGSDPVGYYQYLPAFFLEDWDKFNYLPWAIPFGETKWLSVFTCGVAILWSPFFLLGHFFTIFLGYEANGWGNIYFGFILVAALFYVYVGLLFLYKFLLSYFDSQSALRTTILMFIATNLFYYTTILGTGMSHAYSFSLICIFLYYVQQFYRQPSLKYVICFSLPISLAVLIRPTNVIAFLFVLLYDVRTLRDLKDRFLFWFKNYTYLLVVILTGFVVFIPQMIYWHTVTGKFIYYSYQDFGFSNWLTPKFGVVLFGKFNGWLTYTPLVFFALYGLFALLRERAMHSMATLVILICALYINASWWAPTFSAALGQRAMIDFLPFIAIPLAWSVQRISLSPRRLRIFFLVILLVIIYFNVQFSFRYDPVVWWDSPFTWSKFFKYVWFG